MTTKLWIIAVLIALATIGGIVIKIRNDAAREALSAVERQNNAAGNASDRARSDYDSCPVGMWDFGARKCRGS